MCNRVVLNFTRYPQGTQGSAGYRNVHIDNGCVRSYANSTIGLQMPFGVQPFVTLAYHWYHWPPTGFTIGSIFCRRSRAWVKRFTRENYVIKMEDLKTLSTETSGVTTIVPIQLTTNQPVYANGSQ